MYRVTVLTDGTEYDLHDNRSEELQLIEPIIVQEMGKVGSFDFNIPPTHENCDKIKPLTSEIRVYHDDEMIFCGRTLNKENDFYNTSRIRCEGELAYLIDSIQRPYEFTGSAYDFFTQVLTNHNSQVENWKKFERGNIVVADTSPMVRSNKDFSKTLTALRSQITEPNGGYLHVRNVDGKRYLDCVYDYGGINSQVIRFGENMLDLTSHENPEGIITILVPVGAEIENEDPDTVPERVNITSVNNGTDYIYDQRAIDLYGRVWGSVSFDDVTDPAVLLAKAKAYLEECVVLPETLELRAVDLSLIDVDVHRLQVGCWTNVESMPHHISKRFMLSKMETHLDNPGQDLIVLGQTLPKFTESTKKEQAKISAKIDRVADNTSKEINKKIENATQLITGGLGGYVVLDVYDPNTGEKMHPWRILVMDTPDQDTARHVIQINQNGIGFSTTGINGPYNNAWTIDGNLVADFITAGQMLADRIRGGVLELGGTGLGRDGVFIVKDKHNTEIGRMDIGGLNIKRRGKVGLKADGNVVEIGDFEIADKYGRQILQSSDEITGMCGEPAGEGQLYFWAGFNDDNDYAFVINNAKQCHGYELWLHNWDSYIHDLGGDKYTFEHYPVNYMLVDLYQRDVYLENKLIPVINDLMRRVSALEDN